MSDEGAHCYLIVCVAREVLAVPRDIKEFDEDAVFPGGKLVELDGDWWIELLPRVPVRSLALPIDTRLSRRTTPT